MTDYSNIRTNIIKHNLFADFKPVSSIKMSELEKIGAPQDYMDFLNEFGYGLIGDEYYLIFDGFKKNEEMYGDDLQGALDGIHLIGCDFGGYSEALDSNNNWQVVYIEATGLSTHFGANKFEEFINKEVRAAAESAIWNSKQQ